LRLRSATPKEIALALCRETLSGGLAAVAAEKGRRVGTAAPVMKTEGSGGRRLALGRVRSRGGGGCGATLGHRIICARWSFNSSRDLAAVLVQQAYRLYGLNHPQQHAQGQEGHAESLSQHGCAGTGGINLRRSRLACRRRSFARTNGAQGKDADHVRPCRTSRHAW
jgi:hypothetical protein